MSVEYTQHKARSADNLGLVIHTWEGSAPTHQLLIVHGYAEHGARYREYAHFWLKMACTSLHQTFADMA